jgi:hypothetical protein
MSEPRSKTSAAKNYSMPEADAAALAKLASMLRYPANLGNRRL